MSDRVWQAEFLERALEHREREFLLNLPVREATAIERVIQTTMNADAPFEMGPEGVPPRVRFRRQGRSDGGRLDDPLHLAVVVGDDVEAFRSRLAIERGDPGVGTDLWNTRVLFEETTPELFEAYIAVGDRADALSRNMARAVGFAMGDNGLCSARGTSLTAPVVKRRSPNSSRTPTG